MDDRNLVAVAEQAAATSKVIAGPIAGCTVRAVDGRVFLGCLLEFEDRSEEHTSELQSRRNLVCRLLLEKNKIHF